MLNAYSIIVNEVVLTNNKLTCYGSAYRFDEIKQQIKDENNHDNNNNDDDDEDNEFRREEKTGKT